MGITFPKEFNVDYGIPTGVCSEIAPNSGKYVREWSKATVELDCNTWESSITPRRHVEVMFLLGC
jgi:hypothetical protein